ncbi:DNA mismatch repair protein MutS [Pandoraea eparura]|uniref:DNA mismatch repair protein MutS n=1 Tax=Pandoraea eparura TaxID=2508291 RepID=A0A5E4XLR9_9BURK|nr:DNA mismatch repair protein MutS [Pandoraea eparura]VVE37246.1 DNA mismatch repair protein MutS [Pandoraea eparura]
MNAFSEMEGSMANSTTKSATALMSREIRDAVDNARYARPSSDKLVATSTRDSGQHAALSPSLLYEGPEPAELRSTAPPTFVDLHLGSVMLHVNTNQAEFDLNPILNTPLERLTDIAYRQGVAAELEQQTVSAAVREFAELMRHSRKSEERSLKAYFGYEKKFWFLDAARQYCAAVDRVTEAFDGVDLRSTGLLRMQEYVIEYAHGPQYTALKGEVFGLIDTLANVRYCVWVDGGEVTVYPFGDEQDYSEAIHNTFAKFRKNTVRDYRVNYRNADNMNHVESWIVDLVARRYPDTFSRLDAFTQRSSFRDSGLVKFDNEVAFYLGYFSYIARFREAGLPFCYPDVTSEKGDIAGTDVFDIALAEKLVQYHSSVILNDFRLDGPERIIVVSGPNQGGKTTFARMFGQLHYLAALGLPVPARAAKLYLFDEIFTHFEKSEDLTTLRGKLEDDLFRMHLILEQATSRSVIIMNEIFSSTSLKDAMKLGTRLIEKLSALDAYCVCVTFIDELSTINDKTVSMVSMIDPKNPAVRTFRVERQIADGLAYAHAIAEKYEITYDWLMRRVPS